MKIPLLIYGTAWKEEATAMLTEKALQVGFRGIDTANQAKHYQERMVGAAIKSNLAKGMPRDQLYIQTKFTFLPGQDHRLPYDPKASIATQLEQSFASSLNHLNVDYLDSYLLHGPYGQSLLCNEDWQAWAAIENIYQSGLAKSIGVSNVNLNQLISLMERSKIKPMIVQNRCFAKLGWDKTIREFCQQHSIIYQGFSLLTANMNVLQHPIIHNIAQQHQKTVPQIIFCFAQQIGITPLTGTTDEEHMREDLQSFDFQLTPDEVNEIEQLN